MYFYINYCKSKIKKIAQKEELISKGERLLKLLRTTSVDVEARPYIDDVLDYLQNDPEAKALFYNQKGTENILLKAIEYLKAL